LTELRYGKGDWRDFEQGTRREWLVANGLGGYASSTIINANTRKYHGLLVASLNPPVERTLLLAKIDERFEAGGRTYNLATNLTEQGVAEYGFIHQQIMTAEPVPCFTYSFADVFMEKYVFMVYGQNTTVILYRVRNGVLPATLRLAPLVNCRDFHWTLRRGQIAFNTENIDGGVEIKVTPGVPPLKIFCGAGAFLRQEGWFTGMFYPAEAERGENPVEDHFAPGCFSISLSPGEEKVITVAATIETGGILPGTPDGEELLRAEESRLSGLTEKMDCRDSLGLRLARAADAFVVQRKFTGTKSVIAGYPWFNDWGRDTMIALPGLTLVTGRYRDAAGILLTFAHYCKDGLLPNMFPDKAGEEPCYNTVDASLWYFHAVYKYLQYTGDKDFILEKIYPVLKEIISWHIKGTHFDIHMDDDGLLRAGGPENQLTWMDAKVEHWVVTPRHGKPVEISALWYNALRVMERLTALAGEEFAQKGLAERVRQNFEKEFWYQEGYYYYDVVGAEGKDARFRPNQILALALPFSPAAPERARAVLSRAWRELYATYGLRSLSCFDPEYRGVYLGDRVQRDGAYHQGTVWSWLMGPFITAYRKAHGYNSADRLQAEKFIHPFRDHLRDHGVGYISEIFDGNEPVIPRGCFAQAWGVAEILRAYVEDVLEIRNWQEGIGEE
jgi:predicted glycogen debranching enzyme